MDEVNCMPVKSFVNGRNSRDASIVNFSVRDAKIGNNQISKAGYFFNKCNIIIPPLNILSYSLM